MKIAHVREVNAPAGAAWRLAAALDAAAEPDGSWLAVGESGHEFEQGDAARGNCDGAEHRPQLTGAPIDPDRHGGDELLAEVDSRDWHLH